MTLANAVLAIIWVGVIAYAVFGGADFGAGIWDLLAGGPEKGRRPRLLLERSIGPVWEANHVWLIFVLVYLWTAFPTAFVSIVTTLYIPMMLAGFGIIFRGSSFAFRKWASTLRYQRVFGIGFAASSLVTPFFLGAVAGGVASGRVPLGNAVGDPWTSWINPTSILGGILAVVVSAYVAAVLAARDASRADRGILASYFRTRALASGIAAGTVAAIGIFVIRADAPVLWSGLTTTYGEVVVIVSAAAGLTSLLAIYRHRTQIARVAAVGATVTILWGWGLGQYPWLLPDVLTIEDGAASDIVLVALIVAFIGAALLAVPSLIWLYTLTDRGVLDSGASVRSDTSDALLQSLASRETGDE